MGVGLGRRARSAPTSSERIPQHMSNTASPGVSTPQGDRRQQESRFAIKAKAYVALTKPRVIELLLVTALPTMFLAAGGVPPIGALTATLIGGFLSAGSANTFNMIIDRDIDLKMARTAKRPTTSGLISSRDAAIFGTTLQVLLGLTAQSTDPARGFVQGIHLANTFLLLGALLLTALWASGAPRLRLRGQGLAGLWSFTGLGLVLVLGMAGAVTALGDLLFLPADGTPIDTVRRDFAATAGVIENLRVVHPMLAVLTAAFLVWLGLFLRRERPSAQVNRWSVTLWGVLALQMVAGFANVAFKAPAWMQLTHLLLACALWLAAVLLTYHALTALRATRPAPAGVAA